MGNCELGITLVDLEGGEVTLLNEMRMHWYLHLDRVGEETSW